MSKRVAMVLLILSLVIAVILFRYHYFLSRIPFCQPPKNFQYEKDTYPELTREALRLLGRGHSLSHHPASSYLYFPLDKKAGVIRIGVFGCSFIQGYEIDQGKDFPSFLQKQFHDADAKYVEVINFGVGAYGVGAMYLLWEYLGTKYDLDYVIFMPFSWHRDRDNTFIRSSAPVQNPPHARFILFEGEVKLIPLVGENRREICRKYCRFLPPWRYIYYENKMPLFLKVILPSFLHQRTNPLYYKIGKARAEEIFSIYKLLFEKIAQNARQLIVIANEDEVYQLGEDIKESNVLFLKSKLDKLYASNPQYYTPTKHPSAWANNLRAEEMFNFLIEKYGMSSFKHDTKDQLE